MTGTMGGTQDITGTWGVQGRGSAQQLKLAGYE